MAESQCEQRPTVPPCASEPDWSRLRGRAAAVLRDRFRETGELSPLEVARAVASALPARCGHWLLRRLAELGWLAPDAEIPFDILDGPDCPAEFDGTRRQIVRLALFGLPGQGLAWRDKHRQDVYQQLCAEIMRTAVDLVSLQNIAGRVMSHPDVSGDPSLAAMVRAYIAEREVALRTIQTPNDKHAADEHASKLHHGFQASLRGRFPTHGDVMGSFSRVQREYDGYLAQFEERKARLSLDKMRELRRHFPVHVPAADLQRAEEQYDRLLKRAGTYRRQIKELTVQGADAARAGDLKTATWVIRRLEAIHTLLPTLLPVVRLEELRAEISRGGQEYETAEVTHELRERKKEVAARIRNLAGVIQRFHEIAGRLPPEHNAYRRAEINYRRAVEEIRGLDTEWLTGLVLQLEALLEDLEDPGGEIQSQLDHFIASVRTALNRLCLEIRKRQHGKAAASRQDPPSSEGTHPPQSA